MCQVNFYKSKVPAGKMRKNFLSVLPLVSKLHVLQATKDVSLLLMMVLENDYMIHNVAFSLPITIKRISTANTFPYGSRVKESYRQETNFIRKSYFYTGVVVFFFFFFKGGVWRTPWLLGS